MLSVELRLLKNNDIVSIVYPKTKLYSLYDDLLLFAKFYVHNMSCDVLLYLPTHPFVYQAYKSQKVEQKANAFTIWKKVI